MRQPGHESIVRVYKVTNRRAILARWATTATAIILVIAAGVYLWQRLPILDNYALSGKVRCSSGKLVQGVWVTVTVGDHSTSGFADIRPDPNDPNVTIYTRDLKARSYILHVGCGGTARDWAMTAYAPETRRSTLELTCFDEPADSRYQTCRITQ